MSARAPFRVILHWQDGRQTVEAESYNPATLSGAPAVARNPRVLRRIEVHDRAGRLATVWDACWKE